MGRISFSTLRASRELQQHQQQPTDVIAIHMSIVGTGAAMF